MQSTMRGWINHVAIRLCALFLFLLPWQTRWIFSEGFLGGGSWEYGTLGIYVTEVLLWLAVLFSIPRIRTWTRPVAREWFLVPLFFVIFAAISVLFAPAPLVAFRTWSFIVEAFALVILLASYRDAILFFIAAFIGGVFIQAGMGLAQIVSQHVDPSTWLGIAEHDPLTVGTSVVEVSGHRFLRAYGGLPHPNIFGGYLVVAFGFLLLFLIRKKRLWESVMVWGCRVVLLTALFFTFSRSAWVGLTTILIVLYMLLARVWRERQHHQELVRRIVGIFIVTVLVFGGLGWMFRDVVAGRLVGGTRLEIISRVERVTGVNESLHLASFHPLIGVGVGNYTFALSLLDPGKPSWSYQPVHNAPLLLFAELGFVGLLLFAALIRQFELSVIRVAKQFQMIEQRAIWYPLLGICLAFFVMSMLDHYVWSLYSGLMLCGVVFGFWLNQAKIDKT